MDVSEKKIMLKMFLTEDEVLMEQRRWSKISARSLTLLVFALGWALRGRPQTRTRVNDATLPLLSLSLFNVLTH